MSRYSSPPEEREVGEINEEISDDKLKGIIQAYHMETGHGSIGTLMFLLKSKVKCKNFSQEVRNVVNSCTFCLQEGNVEKTTSYRIIVRTHPGELWECDLIVRAKRDSGRRVFILVAVDHFSKWVEARILGSKKDSVVRNALEDICHTMGINPRRIIIDNGREFHNKAIEFLTKENGISWEFGSPYHHGSTGLVKRYNQTIWSKIRRLSEFGNKQWQRCVGKAVFGCNVSFNRAIGPSLYFVRYGRHPIFEIDNSFPHKEETVKDIEIIHEEVSDAKRKYLESQSRANCNQLREISVGSNVLVYNHVQTSPLDRRWKPGYKVIGLDNFDSYIVEKGREKFKYNKIHVKIDSSV